MNAAPESKDTETTGSPFAWLTWLGWPLAVACALATGYATLRSVSVRTESAMQRENAQLAEMESKSLRQILEAERILATKQVGDLQKASDPRQLQIILLSADGTPANPLAVVAWNPVRDDGLLRVLKLPNLDAAEDYHVWFMSAGSESPVSVGTFRVNDDGRADVVLRAQTPADQIDQITITRETVGSSEPGAVTVARGRR